MATQKQRKNCWFSIWILDFFKCLLLTENLTNEDSFLILLDHMEFC